MKKVGLSICPSMQNFPLMLTLSCKTPTTQETALPSPKPESIWTAPSVHLPKILPPNTSTHRIRRILPSCSFPLKGALCGSCAPGLVETLQRDYHINIAGPTTMSAILNSSQMGFRTLAIQKAYQRGMEGIGAVKTEFNKFGMLWPLRKSS